MSETIGGGVQPRQVSVTELSGLVGSELGSSQWHTIDQHQILTFAEATGDHQWIHVDPERAEEGAFGAIIAHGYLVLSMLPALVSEIVTVTGARANINYGLNQVRFINPVRVNSRVRCTTTLAEVEERGASVKVTYRHVIEIEGVEKPACIAETMTLFT